MMIMKLGKLLGAGKSFFGGGGAKAYRESKHVYLPKFNTDKNPFTPATKESASSSDTPKAQPVVKKALVFAPNPAPVQAPASASLAKTQKMAEPSVLRPVRTKSWTHKLNPFRVSEPVAPPMVNAVQTELSLDSVKPIANDLADADIEVVPVKSRTVARPEPELVSSTRGAWGFSGERMANPV